MIIVFICSGQHISFNANRSHLYFFHHATTMACCDYVSFTFLYITSLCFTHEDLDRITVMLLTKVVLWKMLVTELYKSISLFSHTDLWFDPKMQLHDNATHVVNIIELKILAPSFG